MFSFTHTPSTVKWTNTVFFLHQSKDITRQSQKHRILQLCINRGLKMSLNTHLELKIKQQFCFLLTCLSSHWTQEQELWDLFCSHRCPKGVVIYMNKYRNKTQSHTIPAVFIISTTSIVQALQNKTIFFLCQMFRYDTPNIFEANTNCVKQLLNQTMLDTV